MFVSLTGLKNKHCGREIQVITWSNYISDFSTIAVLRTRLISSIGFTFKIRYSSNCMPLSIGPVSAFGSVEVFNLIQKMAQKITVVSARFCTAKIVRDGKQVETYVWTTCASLARAITFNGRHGAKARLQTINRFNAATIENPNGFGWGLMLPVETTEMGI